jgi:hypothetical protein
VRQLVVYDEVSLRRFVQGNGPPPEPTILAEFAFAPKPVLETRPQGPITRLRWNARGNSLTFIGKNNDGAQVYSVDLNGRLRQLTRSPGEVINYQTNEDGSTAFIATLRPDLGAFPEGIHAQGTDFSSYLESNLPNAAFVHPRFAAFVQPSPSEQPREVLIRHLDTSGLASPETISISPNGRWAAFQSVQSSGQGFTRPDETGEAAVIPSLVVANIRTGAMLSTALFRFTFTDDGPFAAWSPDERHLAVGPLATTQCDTLDYCPTAIAVVDLTNGSRELLTDDPALAQTSHLSLSWDDASGIVLRGRAVISGTYSSFTRTFVRGPERWTQTTQTTEPAQTNMDLVVGVPPVTLRNETEVALTESETQPPRLVARVVGENDWRLLWNINPALDQLSPPQQFEWTSQGRRFNGSLLLPPNTSGPVPIVIELRSIVPQRFWASGEFEDGRGSFPGRSLLSRGIGVLRAPCEVTPERAPQTRAESEGGLATACLESAVQALHARNLAREGDIGLIGFSRTGMLTMHALTFGNLEFAAAAIIDSVSATPASYAATEYQDDFDSSHSVTNMIGAPFYGNGVASWLDRSPVFHLERVRAPIRFEDHTPVHGYWDIFRILRRMGRPAEMVTFPFEQHTLVFPRATAVSQEANLDWFDFWLNGHEDRDPGKVEQYHLWRAMRQQRDALHYGPRPLVRRWTEAGENNSAP